MHNRIKQAVLPSNPQISVWTNHRDELEYCRIRDFLLSHGTTLLDSIQGLIYVENIVRIY